MHTIAFDADDLASHRGLVDAIVARHGPVGTAVVAFGILGDQARAEKDSAHAAAIAHTDYVAQVVLLTVLADVMRAAGGGRLVAFSSVAGVRARRANYVYGSAKAGLDAFCSGLTDALRGSGVHLLLVRPGFVIGRMTEGMTPGAAVEHPCPGRRRHGAGVAQRADRGVGAGAPGRPGVRVPDDAAVAVAEAAPMIVVVGIGADGMPGLAPASRDELRRATVVYGSRRQLELLDDTVDRGPAGVAVADAARAADPARRAPAGTCTWWQAAIRCCTGWAAR